MSSEFVYKPQSDKDGKPAILLPSNSNANQITVTGSDGRRHTLEMDKRTNGNRPTFRVPVNGSELGENFSIDTGSNTFQLQNGDQRTSTTDLQGLSNGTIGNSQRKSGGGIHGGSRTISSPGGNHAAIAEFVDFNAIAPAFVDFDSAFNFGQNLAKENRETFLNDLSDPRIRQTALDLVNTDVQGIITAGTALGDFNRTQGDIDTQTNQNRASSIDQFNLSRLPGFNQFNQNEVIKANDVIRSERDKSINATGLDFRNRANSLLDNLETQATGNLADSTLNQLLTQSNQDRGADIASARGFGGKSTVSGNIQRGLDLDQRLSILQNAQAQLPGVLSSFQQQLQAPEQQAPTLFGQPTDVPLNRSTVADRLQVGSNISAGQAQQNIASQATQIGTIDATTAFGANLDTQRFNETSRVETQFRAGELTQQQHLAVADATQGLINADKGDQIRNEQYDLYRQGLGQRERSQNAQAASMAAGFGGAIAASTPGGVSLPGIGGNIGSGSGGSFTSGGNTILDSALSGNFGQVLQQGTNGILDGITGGSQPSVPSGINPTSTSNSGGPTQTSKEGGLIGQVGEAIGGIGGMMGSAFGGETSELKIGDTAITKESAVEFGKQVQDFLTSGSTSSSDSSKGGLLNTLTQPLGDLGLDGKTVSDAVASISNWDGMNTNQQTAAGLNLGLSVLSNKGLLTGQEAGDVKAAGAALSVITDSTASSKDKGLAIAGALAAYGTTSFAGPASAPTEIGGQKVLGQIEGKDGSQQFRLEDGTVVDSSVVRNSSNAMNGLQALSILTSDADSEQKASALAKMGITGAAANNVISQAQAGNGFAALSVIDTAMNWENMNPIQKAASIAKTSSSVLSTFNSAAEASNIASLKSLSANTGVAGKLATGLGVAGSIAGIAYGIDQAASTIDAADDMPKSQSVKYASTNLATSGAAIGAGVAGAAVATGAAAGSVVPVVGTAIGAAIGATAGLIAGSTGSGKGTGQHMRDGWREALQKGGFAEKIDGSHHVELADGSKYNIGRDGNDKLKNKGVNIDGSRERNTFDVDWSDQNAVDSIPAGHLYAIATGLSPSNGDFDLFDRAVGQGLNAASSNATSVEEINNNFRSMMKNTDPRQVGLRLEMMRQSHDITDQEYQTYLGSLNSIFGSKITPIDREQGRIGLVNMLQSRGKLSSEDSDFLDLIQNGERISAKRQELLKRIG